MGGNTLANSVGGNLAANRAEQLFNDKVSPVLNDFRGVAQDSRAALQNFQQQADPIMQNTAVIPVRG